MAASLIAVGIAVVIVGVALWFDKRRQTARFAEVLAVCPDISYLQLRSLSKGVVRLRILEDPRGRLVKKYSSGLCLREFSLETPAGSASLTAAGVDARIVGRTAHQVSTQTTRPTLTRTLAGGALLGPAGAVVAGLGMKKTKTKTKTVGSQGHWMLTVKAPSVGWDWNVMTPSANFAKKRFVHLRETLSATMSQRPAEVDRAHQNLTNLAERLSASHGAACQARVVELVHQGNAVAPTPLPPPEPARPTPADASSLAPQPSRPRPVPSLTSLPGPPELRELETLRSWYFVLKCALDDTEAQDGGTTSTLGPTTPRSEKANPHSIIEGANELAEEVVNLEARFQTAIWRSVELGNDALGPDCLKAKLQLQVIGRRIAVMISELKPT